MTAFIFRVIKIPEISIISRFRLENRGARKLRPALPIVKDVVSPSSCSIYATSTRFLAHINTQRQTAPRVSPLVTHPCPHIPPGGCCGPLNGRKWGSPFQLPTQSIARPPASTEWTWRARRAPHRTNSSILITTPGVDRREGARGVPLYRPGQLYYCSFINFRFSLVMLPRTSFTPQARRVTLYK